MNAQNTVLFLIIITIRCDEDLKIRVGLPEYICDKDGGIRDVSKDMTTIRLLGKDAQDVSYKFDVNFITIGKKCVKNQRCTLLKWKAVRELDQYLKNYPKDKLHSGLIEINNTMFSPGLKYVLNVTVTKKGKVMEEKQLTLDYVDDSVRKNFNKPMASLLLLAPDNSYAYTSYVVNAEVNICSNISAYYFNWELTDADENSTVLSSRSAELIIPPGTLQGAQTYFVKCNMISIEDGSSMAQSEQSVNVLSKGLVVRLPVKVLTTRSGQDVRIKAFIKDLDNMDGEIRVSWSCVDTSTNEKCNYESDSSEMSLESGSSQPGIYNLSVEISKGDFTETDFCILKVLDNAPVVEIEEIDYPTNPSDGLKIQVMVSELRTFCTLQWTSPNEEGYESFDLASMPGNFGDVVNITMKEDLFLNELEEFTNGTTDRRLDLIIPPPNGEWEGLKGDAKFLFRLTITCPLTEDNFEEFNNTETSITDVVIETNAAPKVRDFEVTPLEGEAFVTSFGFKTQKAEDKEGDSPILYKFGYKLGDRDVIMWNLGDVTNCEGTLPYSEGGIQTFMDACDSYGSCSRVVGPSITTKLDIMNKEVVLQRFVTKMIGKDYLKAFTEAFTILWSYQLDEEPVREVISNKITEEIQKYLETEDKIGANELLKTINDFNSELKLSESVLNKVLELRNKLAEDDPQPLRKLLSLRPIRASSLSLTDVRDYLEISELIITTSNDTVKVNNEKENLRKRLRNYMEKLCTNLKKTQLSLELKTVIFSVEKLKKTSLNNFISVPFEGNSWQAAARVKLGNAVKETKDRCVGKAIFRDYLGKVGFTFFTDVLNTEINDSTEIVIYLPKNKSELGNPKCLVYYDSRWRSECKLMQNIAGYVKCLCKHLGYFHVQYTTKATSAPTAAVAATVPTAVPTLVAVTEKVTGNETSEKLEKGSQGNYDTVSYVVIGVSVVGIIILAITIRKIFHDDEENEEAETFDFPKYAQLHNEEFLNDAHM